MKVKVKRLYTIIIVAILLISCQDKAQVGAIRGVWLTNVDSEAMFSEENISKAVDLAAEEGFNTIFAVVWNKGRTLYPSSVMERITGVKIDSVVAEFDPLKTLVEYSHNKGIKIFAWFEFGFSSSYKLDGGELLAAKPEWRSIGADGKLVTKNGFDWMNGFDPEVQDFMVSLIEEVIVNYDIDGIQGDDRLPAMPSEAGYDDYTIGLYKNMHGGKLPPTDSKDSAWVQFRADLMSQFMERIFRKVKSIKPEILISMSPSIYPWSKEEYLQDWPAWLEKGYVDFICPQVYRYSLDEYRTAIRDIVDSQIAEKDLHRLYPGILLKLGDYYASEKFLNEMIAINRKAGIKGEVFFFFEGIKKYPGYFGKNFYKEQVGFPELSK